MKKTAYAVLALALTAGSALAADLPSRKGPPEYLPPPPPPPMWTGFYAGLNAGYTWGNSNNVDVANGTVFNNVGALSPLGLTYGPTAALASSGRANVSSDGFIGGGQLGYNWQFYNNFLVGFETDIQGLAGANRTGGFFGIADRGLPAPGVNFVQSSVAVSKNIDYIGTVRGRLGWLFTPTLLVYGTGGLAYGGVQSTTAIAGGQVPNTGSTPFFGAGAFADTLVGWTAGGGVEWMFWPNWSAKVEYLYYDLGNITYNSSAMSAFLTGTTTTTFTNVAQTTTRFDGHIVRAGLNYHFNWGSAPVVAKY